MVRYQRTKIIATVGPACNSKEALKELILAGTDIFRLNFSHGTHEGHAEVVKYIKELNRELNTHVGILQDLQGPKIRLGEVEKGTKIKAESKFVITTDELIGNGEKASTTYQHLPKDVRRGDSILIDDGKIELKVEEVIGNDVYTKVVHGGKLKSRKGINLPETVVSAPSLTPKDEEDLQFAIEHDLEWVALSFVRYPSDIDYLRGKIEKSGVDIRIVAKIEKPEALANIDEIIQKTDAVMVARGDLGVEIKMEEVPIVQKKIVKMCREAAKPVIIATQMMESMIENPRPTRAETNDVANAVMDGADCLMLSAETAAGEYPVQTVKYMGKTIELVEEQEGIYHRYYDIPTKSLNFINDGIVQTAVRVSETTGATSITGLTQKGYAGFRIASHRPKARIFIFTHSHKMIRILNLVWGVKGLYYNRSDTTDQTISDINATLRKQGEIKKGDIFITLLAMPIGKPGRANTIKVNVVE